MRAVLEQRSSTVSLALGTVRPERSGLRAQSSELEIESRLVVAATASRKGNENKFEKGHRQLAMTWCCCVCAKKLTSTLYPFRVQARCTTYVPSPEVSDVCVPLQTTSLGSEAMEEASNKPPQRDTP